MLDGARSALMCSSSVGWRCSKAGEEHLHWRENDTPISIIFRGQSSNDENSPVTQRVAWRPSLSRFDSRLHNWLHSRVWLSILCPLPSYAPLHTQASSATFASLYQFTICAPFDVLSPTWTPSSSALTRVHLTADDAFPGLHIGPHKSHRLSKENEIS